MVEFDQADSRRAADAADDGSVITRLQRRNDDRFEITDWHGVVLIEAAIRDRHLVRRAISLPVVVGREYIGVRV